jgi:hypothetical protein
MNDDRELLRIVDFSKRAVARAANSPSKYNPSIAAVRAPNTYGISGRSGINAAITSR